MPRAARLAFLALSGALAAVACSESSTKSAADTDYICEAVVLTPVPHGQKLVIAHRGAATDLPENSTEALVAAAEFGANAVEFDVVLSEDGVPVVMHDNTLDRMTDCKGDLREKTWAEISAYRLDGGYEIPRLDMLLPKLSAYRRVFVEIKTDDDQAEAAAIAVGKIVQEQVLYDQVVVTSYNLRALYTLERVFGEPRIHIGYDGQDVDVLLATVNMGFDYALMSYPYIDRCTFSLAEQMRVKLVTYTVKDKDDLFTLNDGLFREYAYGIMFDDLSILRDNRDDLERKLGQRLDGPKQCKGQDVVWDRAAWTCATRCSASTCGEDATCDAKTGLCVAEIAPVQTLEALFSALGPLIEAGRAAEAHGDAEALETATAALQAEIAPESPYHERIDLLATILFSQADRHAEVLDWSQLDRVVVDDTRATLTTAAGTEWYFWRGDAGWQLAFVQTP
jgi:glycerophosphoryl diester phosphodiesterase